MYTVFSPTAFVVTPFLSIREASLDPGHCSTFDAHRILLGAGIYGIENLSDAIAGLPASGAVIAVMPLKITGGSGAPARVVAFCNKGF